MSNRMFGKGRQNFAAGSLDWDAHDFCFMPIRLDGTLTDLAIKAVSGCTVATPGVVTVTAHGWANGDIVVIRGVGGTLNANGTFKVAGQATNSVDQNFAGVDDAKKPHAQGSDSQ